MFKYVQTKSPVLLFGTASKEERLGSSFVNHKSSIGRSGATPDRNASTSRLGCAHHHISPRLPIVWSITPAHRRSRSRGRAEWGASAPRWDGWRATPSLLSSCSCSHPKSHDIRDATRQRATSLSCAVTSTPLALIQGPAIRARHQHRAHN